MGKASKKMKRKNQQQNNVAAMQKGKRYAQEMDAHLSQGEYAEALDALAGMIEAKDIRADYIYKGAYCYFMQEDYEKAAQWVSNTLYYDANHIDARLLLARICSMEDRENDMLAILERVLVHGGADLTEEQQETIRSLVNPSVEVDASFFPHVAAFCQRTLSTENPVGKAEESRESALSTLQRLKEKVMRVAREDSSAMSETLPEAGTDSEKKEREEAKETKETSEAARDSDSTTKEKIAEILAQSISLREKVQLLNRFAGAAFIAKDFDMAYSMLKAALEIDDKDSSSIRNMTILLAVQGEKEKALEIAASLPETDFALLQQIAKA